MQEYKTVDQIAIKTNPETIWSFFQNLERNYLDWHRQDHIVLKWIKGKPHTEGSIVYAEEYILGKRVKIKMKCVEIIEYQKIRYKTLFPLSLFHPGSEYTFENTDAGVLFTATNYFRIPYIFRNHIMKLIKATEVHIREEAINLKRILEEKD